MTMRWHNRFMDLATMVASWSKDPSTKVGCVMVDDYRRVVGMGYNGFPRGVNDAASRYEDRETKYALVQHAEANAILNATGSVVDCVAYITHPPCSTCTGLLIQGGIGAVICKAPNADLRERFKTSFELSRLMLGEAMVSYQEIEDMEA